MKILRKKRNQKGAALVEYGLLVGLIAVVAIAAITGLGGAVDEKFTSACNSLTSTADTNTSGTADGCE